MLKIHQKIKNAKPATLSSPQPLQIKKGETTLTLTDVKTGEVQVYHDTNMQTNALNEMLRNCGWMNRDNWDQNNLITQLLGGVLLFDTAITEDANIVIPPAGITMTANCSVDATTTQSGDPTELGTYRPDESGPQGDGSYLLTYDWATAQGNGTIACICATNRQFGYGGDGNFHSGVSKSSLIYNSLIGSVPTDYNLKYIPCRVDMDDSSCYFVDFTDRANGNVTIRKCRLPINKVNLRGTTSSLQVLSEVTLSGDDVPSQLLVELSRTGYEQPPLFQRGGISDTGEGLVITNQPQGAVTWGEDYTQYLWEIDVVNATITESVLTNTSGDQLYGIINPIWLSKDCLAWTNGYCGYSYSAKLDGRTVYSMKRTNGVWGTIQKCSNPAGWYAEQRVFGCGFDYPLQVSGDKAYIESSDSNTYRIIVFDFVANRCTLTNQRAQSANYRLHPTNKPFIGYQHEVYLGSDPAFFRMHRTQYAIATINNLSTPVVKDSSKMMKLQYRFTFEEEPEPEEENN